MPPPTLFEEATGFTIEAELIEYIENNVHLPTQLLKSNGDYTSTGDERAPTDEETWAILYLDSPNINPPWRATTEYFFL
ncbi:hypothetical protein DDE83_006416 [Stemphylium lycopersici]|uniref:Uncharacterized protein n=1 Tax=Stemphylium lycopersici TaxID=183478 RepID=A0A364MZ11_STELY|nr:hypothetical protein DDE83_006416 [Stemphylium lycopersici]